MNSICIRCLRCNRILTIKDLDPDRPVIYCNRCNKGYVNKVITQIYRNAVKFGIKDVMRTIHIDFKNILGI